MLSNFAGGLARQVARLLREDPTGWRSSGYKLRHNSGLVVWVANGAYGLHIVTPDGDRLWDVTMWCLVGGSPNQQHVWRAVKERRALAVKRLVREASTQSAPSEPPP